MKIGKQLKDDINLIKKDLFIIENFIKDDFYLEKYPNIKKYLFNLYFPKIDYINSTYLVHHVINDLNIDIKIDIKNLSIDNKNNKYLWGNAATGPVG